MDLAKTKLFRDLKKKYGYDIAANKELADGLDETELLETLLVLEVSDKIAAATDFVAKNWSTDGEAQFELNYVLTSVFSRFIDDIIKNQEKIDGSKVHILEQILKESINDRRNNDPRS